MDKKALTEMKQKLLQQKAELEELETTLKESSQPVELDQSRVGRLSRMDAMQAQHMALEAARRRREQLLKIESALRRLESGEYGYCLACDEVIDSRRLSFDPANTHCVSCAEKISRR